MPMKNMLELGLLHILKNIWHYLWLLPLWLVSTGIPFLALIYITVVTEAN